MTELLAKKIKMAAKIQRYFNLIFEEHEIFGQPGEVNHFIGFNPMLCAVTLVLGRKSKSLSLLFVAALCFRIWDPGSKITHKKYIKLEI